MYRDSALYPPEGEEVAGIRATRIGRRLRFTAGLVLLLVLLYLTRLHSYNLFHSLAELFSVAVAFAVFAIAWHTRQFAKNYFLLFVGAGLVAVAVTDTLHLLAYKGMGVFESGGADLPTQLWLVGRYEYTLALLLAPLLLAPTRRRLGITFGLFSTVWVGLLLVVFAWPIFPTALVDDQGLTLFKKVSEYAVCVLLLVALALLYRRRRLLETRIFALLAGSIAVTIVSELAFTLYTDPYGGLNLVGHYLKIVAFLLLYLAIVQRTLVAPYSLLFRDLREREREREELVARLDGVGQVTEAAMQTLEIHELMDSVLARVVPLMHAQAAVILRKQGDHLTAVSSHGLEEEVRERFTLPIGHGVSGWVGATRSPLYIADVQNDPRVASRLLLSNGIRSMIAIPLLRGEDLLGVMHIDWTEPTEVGAADLRFLELLGDRVAVALFNADLYTRQKEVAEILQGEMLAMPHDIAGISVGHTYRSASEGAHVGGDFYDVFSDDGSRAWILIGDVSGHGVQAATSALLIREVTRAFVQEVAGPADVLHKVNRAVVQRLEFGQYATLFLGALDPSTGRLEYCSAGHPPGFIVASHNGSASGRSVRELAGHALPIGAFPDARYQPAEVVSLAEGETLVLYTDGVTEARAGTQFFGEERLKQALRTTGETCGCPAEILAAVDSFSGGRLRDDLAILCITR